MDLFPPGGCACRALPVGVILTLSASGSEMSASCVITNEENGFKRGFNSVTHRPLFSICNPELTCTVSKYQTACGTVDIMMHTLERYFSKTRDTELTDRIAEALLNPRWRQEGLPIKIRITMKPEPLLCGEEAFPTTG